MPELEDRLGRARPMWPAPSDDLERQILLTLEEHATRARQAPRKTFGSRRRWRLGARALALGAVALAVVVAGALLNLTEGPASKVLPSDGSVVERAAAAIRPTGEIEHVRSIIDGTRYEYWSLSGVSSRTVTTDSSGRTTQYTAGPVCSVLAGPPRAGADCASTGEAIEEALTSGHAHVAGDATLDGRALKRIVFTANSPAASGVYEVDARTMAPVRLVVTLPGGKTRDETYQVFEYLPATAETKPLAGAPSAP